MSLSKKLEGVVIINGTNSNKVKILTKDYIVYITFVYWFIKSPIIYFKFKNNILKYSLLDLILRPNYIYKVLHYNQIYNFDLNHDHKLWIIIIIKDIQNQNQQHPIHDSINVHLKGSTHVAFLMKYVKTHNKFENIWWRFD